MPCIGTLLHPGPERPEGVCQMHSPSEMGLEPAHVKEAGEVVWPSSALAGIKVAASACPFTALAYDTHPLGLPITDLTAFPTSQQPVGVKVLCE